MIPYSEAISTLLQTTSPFANELVPINEAYGRVLAEDVCADRDYPPFHRACVDGFAVNVKDIGDELTFSLPMSGEIFAGDNSEKYLLSKTCMKIMTGAALPLNANAVVMVEQTLNHSNNINFSLKQSLKEWHYVALKGEDVRANERVLQSGMLCDNNVLSVLASFGKSQVVVYKQPKVALIATGDEVVSVDSKVLANQIRNSNSFAVKSLLRNLNIEPSFDAWVTDSVEALEKVYAQIANYEIIIFMGGVSMGEADFIPQVLNKAGVKQLVYKAAIRPGKPIWLGKTPNTGAVFGLPGNPMSTQICFKIFVEPYLRACMQRNPDNGILLPLACKRVNNLDLDVHFPCKIIDNQLHAIPSNGSGDVRVGLGSDGFAVHPRKLKELQEGDLCKFTFWKSPF